MTKTFMARPATITKKWFIVDAEGQTLGRLASQVAYVLRGKHKPTYTPHMDDGDNVIIINAEKVRLSGSKEEKKIYYRHTGYLGGLRSENAAEVRTKHPIRLLESAIKGMLPHNVLGRECFRNVKVYAGSEHPHAAQQPEALPPRVNGRK